MSAIRVSESSEGEPRPAIRVRESSEGESRSAIRVSESSCGEADNEDADDIAISDGEPANRVGASGMGVSTPVATSAADLWQTEQREPEPNSVPQNWQRIDQWMMRS